MPQDRPAMAAGTYVVYWMTASRRTRWNFALQRAIGWARELKRPLLIVEVLVCGGRWDSDRHHPGGSWDRIDNAMYSVQVLANQVRDTSGHTVQPKELGQFTVSIPLAGAANL
ncbi:MAG: hypothetical protein HUU20_26420 [Pirellulales bacterium]|nr:hypothetical protein [Pirellulales bacterium]